MWGQDGAPCQPPVPSRSVGLPPEPPPPQDGHGGTARACAPLYTWFALRLWGFFVHFKPRVGFTSSLATVSASLAARQERRRVMRAEG